MPVSQQWRELVGSHTPGPNSRLATPLTKRTEVSTEGRNFTFFILRERHNCPHFRDEKAEEWGRRELVPGLPRSVSL